MTDRTPHRGAPMGDDPFHRVPGHEREIDRDINLRGLGMTILGLFLGTVFAMFAMWWMFEALLSAEIANDPEPPPLVEARTQVPPPTPRLQAKPERDLEQWNAHQNALKTSYGWREDSPGAARIPVNRAIELIAEEGMEGALGAMVMAEAVGADSAVTPAPPEAAEAATSSEPVTTTAEAEAPAGGGAG